MANANHVNVLLSGVQNWNFWRHDNPGIVPDLSELRLSPLAMQWGLDFGGPVDFRGVCFRGAVLNSANFRGAVFGGADLRSAQLAGARLMDADMRDADFSYSHFLGSNLRDAKLDRCRLFGADLTYVFNLEVSQMLPAHFDKTTLTPFEIEFAESGVKIQDKGVLLEQPRGRYVDVMPGVTLPPVPPPTPTGKL